MTPTKEALEAVGIGIEIASQYNHLWTLPDGRICGVHRLMYHWTVHVGLDYAGYEDRWCFHEFNDAVIALLLWDGTGDMPGNWHKHLKTGRRRNPNTGVIWPEDEIEPTTGESLVGTP